MKFLTMVTTDNPEAAGAPPPALFAAIGELAMQAGPALKESGGMSTTGTVRVKGGELFVDGPYAEGHEVIGGFAVYEFDSKDEAMAASEKFIELHRTHWPVWEGEIIVRQLMQY